MEASSSAASRPGFAGCCLGFMALAEDFKGQGLRVLGPSVYVVLYPYLSLMVNFLGPPLQGLRPKVYDLGFRP